MSSAIGEGDWLAHKEGNKNRGVHKEQGEDGSLKKVRKCLEEKLSISVLWLTSR